MVLPCTDFNYTSPIYPPGFDPVAIRTYLNTTKDCFWFDDALIYMNENRYGDQDSGWEPLVRTIWRNIIPEDNYNKSLFHCYDVTLGEYHRMPNVSRYINGALHCCNASSFAAGDQDLGGVGVSIQTLHRLAFLIERLECRHWRHWYLKLSSLA